MKLNLKGALGVGDTYLSKPAKVAEGRDPF